jgi:hypothetical protein
MQFNSFVLIHFPNPRIVPFEDDRPSLWAVRSTVHGNQFGPGIALRTGRSCLTRSCITTNLSDHNRQEML